MAKKRAKPKGKAIRRSSSSSLPRPIHREWPAEWQALIDAFGGTAELLGKAIGVSGMTIGRWADGLVDPGEPTKRLVNSLADAHRIKRPFKV